MRQRSAHVGAQRACVALVLLCTCAAWAGPMDDGERAYVARDYRTALDAYKRALTYDLNEENRARC